MSVTLSVLQTGTARWQPSHPSLGRAPPELCLRGRVGERAQILQILYEESGEAPVSLAFRLAFVFDHSVNQFGNLCTMAPRVLEHWLVSLILHGMPLFIFFHFCIT